MQHSSGGLRSAPSALDEDTLVKIALQISKDEDERMRESLESKPEREELQVEEFDSEEDDNHHSSPEASPSIPALVPANDEVGQRIKGAPTRRHIPRQNSEHWSKEPSSSADDRQRLLDNLKLYQLVEKEVKGDGNCQFRALSDQLYETSTHHSGVRQQVVKQLRSSPEFYKGFVDDDFVSYCSSMGKNGTWGDHITLQAAADAFSSRILIISSFQEECVIEILPTKQYTTPGSQKRTLFLSFWHEVHYGSVYPQGRAPPPDPPHRTMGSKRFYKFIHN